MKKKILIASLVILLIFILGLSFSLRQAKKTLPSPSPLIDREKAAQQTQDDKTSAEEINKIHEQYPWYSKIPIETKDYRIIFDFEKNSFRVRLLTQDTAAIRQAALNDLKVIGVDLNFYSHYFLEPESGFENLLR